MSDIKNNDLGEWAKLVQHWEVALAHLAEGPGVKKTWEVWGMVSAIGRPILFKMRQVRPSDKYYKKGLDRELDVFYEYAEAFVDVVEKVYGESFCRFVQTDTAEQAWGKVVEEIEGLGLARCTGQANKGDSERTLAYLKRLDDFSNDEEYDVRKYSKGKNESTVWHEFWGIITPMIEGGGLVEYHEVLDTVEKELYDVFSDGGWRRQTNWGRYIKIVMDKLRQVD